MLAACVSAALPRVCVRCAHAAFLGRIIRLIKFKIYALARGLALPRLSRPSHPGRAGLGLLARVFFFPLLIAGGGTARRQANLPSAPPPPRGSGMPEPSWDFLENPVQAATHALLGTGPQTPPQCSPSATLATWSGSLRHIGGASAIVFSIWSGSLRHVAARCHCPGLSLSAAT
jgi:hypothetical protein